MCARDVRVGFAFAAVLLVFGGFGQSLARAAQQEAIAKPQAPDSESRTDDVDPGAKAKTDLDPEPDVDDEKPSAMSPAVRQALAWLPEDTETLVVSGGFTIQITPEVGPPADFESLLQTLPFFELEGCDGEFLKPLAGRKVALALRGDRNFEVVSAFGAYRSEGCAIVAFEHELGDAGKEWTRRLRKAARAVRRIAGREVFVFPSTAVMERQPKPWQATYLLLLKPDTLLCATSDKYLEEVLNRVDHRQETRALADELPEWKHVDHSAAVWMLRHVPEGHGHDNGRRLFDGVAWSITKNRLRVVYVPVEGQTEDAEDEARERWTPAELETNAKIETAKDGTVVVSGEIKSTDDNGTLWLIVNLLGLLALDCSGE